MIRFAMKALVPIMAGLLLDRYCAMRARHTHKEERRMDLTRWEGEGGNPVTPASASRTGHAL